MLLVFGGTTEGKIVAKLLEKLSMPYFYSTKTQTDFSLGNFGKYRHGAFQKEDLITFCRMHGISHVIHAAHPFATQLHHTIEEVASIFNIPVFRFERQFPERSGHSLVHYVRDYESAIILLHQLKIKRLLALTGVQSIKYLTKFWRNNFTLFRILPRKISVDLALSEGFPIENLIAEMPQGNIEGEIALIRKYNTQAIITKESGYSGFFDVKISAALAVSIPLIVLEKPLLPDSFIVVNSEEELENRLKKIRNDIVAHT